MVQATALSFGHFRHPPQFERQRTDFLHMLIHESIRGGGQSTIRVGTPTGHGDGMNWHRRGFNDDGNYGYRTVLPTQITFDIGDDLDDGSPRPWLDTKRDTQALWDVLNWLGAPYWGSLTDGKGTDTTLFLEEVPQCGRGEVAKAIIAIVNATLGNEMLLTNPFLCDSLLLDPNEGARQLREFGTAKNGRTPFGKALWTVGPAPYRPLSDTIEETYSILAMRIRSGEQLRIPKSIPRGEPTLGLIRLQEFARTQGGGCPRGAQCYPGPHRDPLDWDSTCEECPLNV